MRTKEFFEEQKVQSEIKTLIVSGYFDAWFSIMKINMEKYKYFDRIGYIDLFSGPGKYVDGQESTPLIILRKTINNDWLSNHLVTIFNDIDESYVNTLNNNIKSLEGIEKLKYHPQVTNKEVGDEIAEQLTERRFIPSLIFLDPCGYKGLSMKLFESVIKD